MKFKNNSGVPYLRGLFFETTEADKSTVVYTLKDQDHEGYPSLYRLYMESNDPLEYTFANNYLGGWTHWKKLCATAWFKEYVERWREELELRIRSEALVRIRVDAESNSKTAAQANRLLLDGGWKEQKKNEKGRPTKQAIKEAADRKAEEDSQLKNDLLRIQNIRGGPLEWPTNK